MPTYSSEGCADAMEAAGQVPQPEASSVLEQLQGEQEQQALQEVLQVPQREQAQPPVPELPVRRVPRALPVPEQPQWLPCNARSGQRPVPVFPAA